MHGVTNRWEHPQASRDIGYGFMSIHFRSHARRELEKAHALARPAPRARIIQPSLTFFIPSPSLRPPNPVAVKPVPGLHRVPGDIHVVATCASRYDTSDPAPLRGVRDARAVASVLKLYLDSLPVPLMSLLDESNPRDGATFSLPSISKTQTRAKKVNALRQFIQEHVSINQLNALRATTAHLKRVAAADAADGGDDYNDDSNHSLRLEKYQTTKALARSFSKTLCGDTVGDREHRSLIVELLIEHHCEIFTGRKVTNVAAENEHSKNQSSEDKENRVESVDGKKTNTQPVVDTHGNGSIRVMADTETNPTNLEPSDSDGVENLIKNCLDKFILNDDHLCAESDRICGSNLSSLYTEMPIDDSTPFTKLAHEKTNIKRRLRGFDNVIIASRANGAPPSKDDKKHLRPLYLRLAKVKRQMAVAQETERAPGVR